MTLCLIIYCFKFYFRLTFGLPPSWSILKIEKKIKNTNKIIKKLFESDYAS
jgi:hypothetical protein